MKKLFVFVLWLFLAGLSRADLAGTINGIISQPSEKEVKYSIQIVKADSGRIVYSRNANTPMVPASNMKIVTTAAALKYLGPDFEYVIKVGLSDNSLVVIGSGDPLFGYFDTDSENSKDPNIIFQNIINALKQKKISAINDIIIDTSIFDDQRTHPNWPADQLNREYACEISGLNFHTNCIYMTVKNVGGVASISFEPQTGYVDIINQVKTTGKSKGAVGAYRQTEKLNTFLVSGTCKKLEGPFAVAIERPGAFFGFVLAEHLNKAGISVTGKLLEKPLDADTRVVTLAEFRTPMAECIARCNKDSLGLAAESLLKTMAAKARPDGKNGSWAAGQQIIRNYLRTAGVSETEFNIDDGSGLSRENRLSANALTKVLLEIYRSKNWSFYKNSLAIAGQDGTIARYFKEKNYNGKIFGKTGYLSGVKSFSGICSTDNGDYIFSILTNDAGGKTRDAINDIAKAIIDNQ
jgi:D-alanyl-D-alanine carboxypeptidase/D-alanyl-D-alanine-endopeptidase (penicillin-binding protein 4)